jgi:pSer/pThr/pTyr-binding forkhead associated (FHA) protein
MSEEHGKERKSAKRDHGPQGTHVFSRGDVDKIIQEAGNTDTVSTRAQLRGVSVEVKGRVFPLEGDRCVIGRADSCHITLTDSSVSSEHARLSHDSTGWRIANLLSTNGTFVNDTKVSSEALHHGDRVRLGRVEFLFQNPDEQNAAQGSTGRRSGQSWLPWAIGAGVVAVGLVAYLLLT